MAFQRYSAVEMFGAPIDDGMSPENVDELFGLMAAYGFGGQDISREPTDITPYYWRNPGFRYFLSLAHPEGPALVELLPIRDDSEVARLDVDDDEAALTVLPDKRTIEIPTDTKVYAMIGGSPRFAGKMCLHELIAYFD